MQENSKEEKKPETKKKTVKKVVKKKENEKEIENKEPVDNNKKEEETKKNEEEPKKKVTVKKKAKDCCANKEEKKDESNLDLSKENEKNTKKTAPKKVTKKENTANIQTSLNENTPVKKAKPAKKNVDQPSLTNETSPSKKGNIRKAKRNKTEVTPLTTVENTKNKNISFITRVSVENFPSRAEILSLIDKALEGKNFPNNYTTDNKDTKLTITFKSIDPAYEFVKVANIEKMRNPLYKKLKINLNVETYTPYLAPPKHSLFKSNSTRIIRADKKEEDKKKNPFLKFADEYNKKFKEKNRRHRECSLEKSSVNAACPYIDPYLVERQSILENKNKWVAKHNFNACVGKRTIDKYRYLGDFVNNTPSVPFVFRKGNKDKWIEKKGFMP